MRKNCLCSIIEGQCLGDTLLFRQLMRDDVIASRLQHSSFVFSSKPVQITEVH